MRLVRCTFTTMTSGYARILQLERGKELMMRILTFQMNIYHEVMDSRLFKSTLWDFNHNTVASATWPNTCRYDEDGPLTAGSNNNSSLTPHSLKEIQTAGTGNTWSFRRALYQTIAERLKRVLPSQLCSKEPWMWYRRHRLMHMLLEVVQRTSRKPEERVHHRLLSTLRGGTLYSHFQWTGTPYSPYSALLWHWTFLYRKSYRLLYPEYPAILERIVRSCLQSLYR